MKKISIPKVMLAGATAASCLVLSGCGNKQQAPPPIVEQPAVVEAKPGIVPAEKTTFDKVTSELNPGGNFYMYVSTEQLLGKVDELIDGAETLMAGFPKGNGDEAKLIENGFKVARAFVDRSGMKDATGLGVSSVAIEKGIYHSKAILHHREGQGDGFLWTTFGKEAKPLNGLSYLPSNTVIADYGEVNIKELVTVFEELVLALDAPQGLEGIKELKQAFQAGTGLEWDAFLNTYGGDMGFAMTLDDSQQVPLPFPGDEPLTIPAPGLLIMLEVADDLLFDHVGSIIPKDPSVDRGETNGVRYVSMPLPIPLPVQLTPTLARFENQLILGSTKELVMEAVAVHKGEAEGLTSTDEFKSLSREMPTEGNGFFYSSKRFGETVNEIQAKAMEMAGGEDDQITAVRAMLTNFSEAKFGYVVIAHEKNGWKMTGNANFQPAFSFLAGGMIAPAGLMAAIAIPNFVKARSSAQKNTCIANLKQLDGAKQQWALDNKKGPLDTPKQSDLIGTALYIKIRATCPNNGTYTIGAVKDFPKCSHEGHELR